MRTEREWEAAWDQFESVREEYRRLRGTPGVNVDFALAHTFRPLAARYLSGERTDELYAALLAVE